MVANKLSRSGAPPRKRAAPNLAISNKWHNPASAAPKKKAPRDEGDGDDGDGPPAKRLRNAGDKAPVPAPSGQSSDENTDMNAEANEQPSSSSQKKARPPCISLFQSLAASAADLGCFGIDLP